MNISKSNYSYPSKSMQELFTVIVSLKSSNEASDFFRDLCTMTELTDMANRWQMVKMLYKGHSYEVIAKKLHTSTATVTRVAHWLHHGMGGYKSVADRLFSHTSKK